METPSEGRVSQRALKINSKAHRARDEDHPHNSQKEHGPANTFLSAFKTSELCETAFIHCFKSPPPPTPIPEALDIGPGGLQDTISDSLQDTGPEGLQGPYALPLLDITGIHLLWGSGLPYWVVKGSLCLSSPFCLLSGSLYVFSCTKDPHWKTGFSTIMRFCLLPSLHFKNTFKGPHDFPVKIQMNLECQPFYLSSGSL